MSSRKEAKRLGKKTYHGRSCQKCGTTLKWVSKCACVECGKSKNRLERQTPEYKNARKHYDLNRRYGLSKEEYNKLLDQFEHRCAICDVEASKLKKGLCVDHDHTTGKIRGLLCDRCNRGLGMFQDDIKMLQNATLYLSQSL